MTKSHDMKGNLMRHKISVFFEITEKNGTVLFDADCPLCLAMVKRMRLIWEPRGFDFVPLQADWVRRRLELPESELLREMRVLTYGGMVLGGADAHAYLWRYVWWLWPLWLAAKMPGLGWLIDRTYHWVAANRYRFLEFSACDDRCALPNPTTHKRKEKTT